MPEQHHILLDLPVVELLQLLVHVSRGYLSEEIHLLRVICVILIEFLSEIGLFLRVMDELASQLVDLVLSFLELQNRLKQLSFGILLVHFLNLLFEIRHIEGFIPV